MSPSVIFFDIDGTIVDLGNSIPKSAVVAIEKCRKMGNLCIINTGRPFSHIEHSVIDIGFDGYICSCGEHIILNGKTVYRETIEPELCRKVVNEARRCGLDAFYEAEEGYSYLLAPNERNWEIHWNMDRFVERGYPGKLDLDKKCQFDKFCVWGHENSDMKGFLEFAMGYFEIIPRGETMYECVIKGCSKETGILKAMEIAGINLENSYAIGDSNNDLPMLRCVRHSIAMGNAPDSVKKEAEFVTKDIHEDGLAWALENIVMRQ